MLARPHILIVEDEPGIADTLQYALRTDGFDASCCATGEEALQRLREQGAALVILDVGLPDMNGFEVFKRLRAFSDVPALFLTARSDEIDRVVGLELGADDYVAKPFSPRELVLRAQSILRRSVGALTPEAPFRLGDFSIDPSNRTVAKAENELTLTAREFDLLAFFLKHPNQVFSREQLLKEVWRWDFGDLSTVTVHVRRLREKIEDDPTKPRHLTTVWAVGYRMSV